MLGDLVSRRPVRDTLTRATRRFVAFATEVGEWGDPMDLRAAAVWAEFQSADVSSSDVSVPMAR